MKHGAFLSLALTAVVGAIALPGVPNRLQGEEMQYAATMDAKATRDRTQYQ